MRIVPILALALLTTGTAGAQTLATAAFGNQIAAQISALAAVWHSPQQGMIIDLRGRTPQLFHSTSDACWPDEQAAQAVSEQLKFVRSSADKTHIKVAAAAGASETLLMRLDTLPARCNEKPARSPRAVLQALDQTMAEHFAFFDIRGVNWAESVARAKARVTDATTEAALYEELASLLGSMNDPHTTLQATIDGKERRLVTGRGVSLTALREAFEAQSAIKSSTAFFKEWLTASRSAVEARALKAKGVLALGGTAYWSVSNDPRGNVGYLSLTKLKDLTPNESVDDDLLAVDKLLDAFIAACANCKAVIIDLSQNRGGEDRVALAVAARFADQVRTAYTKQAVSRSASADVQTMQLIPSTKPRWLGEVVLLTDSVTVSAAEVLTLALRALPQVKHVGQTTRGALSDALEKSLPNGWRWSLSNEIYKDAAGQMFEGRGIAPSETFTVFDTSEPFAGPSKVVSQLLENIRAR